MSRARSNQADLGALLFQRTLFAKMETKRTPSHRGVPDSHLSESRITHADVPHDEETHMRTRFKSTLLLFTRNDQFARKNLCFLLKHKAHTQFTSILCSLQTHCSSESTLTRELRIDETVWVQGGHGAWAPDPRLLCRAKLIHPA